MSFIDRLADAEGQHSNHIAVIDATSGRRHTFQGFDKRANQIAHFCEGWVGLLPGDCVGLLATPSDDVLQIIVAASKFGLTALLLDPGESAEALTAAINQHSPRTVFYGLPQAALVREIWFEVDSVEHFIPLRGAVDTANFEDIVAHYPPTPPLADVDEKTPWVCFASEALTWSTEELLAGGNAYEREVGPLHRSSALQAALQALQSGWCVVIETDALRIIEPVADMSPTEEEWSAYQRNVPRGRSWLPHEFL